VRGPLPAAGKRRPDALAFSHAIPVERRKTRPMNPVGEAVSTDIAAKIFGAPLANIQNSLITPR